MKLLVLACILLLIAVYCIVVWQHPWHRAQFAAFLRKTCGLRINQAQAAEQLRDVSEIFSACGLEFWLTEGTALGAIREGRVIPTDTDMDIGIVDRETLLECALPQLQSRGFMVWRNVRDDGGEGDIVSVVRDFLRLDIMIFRQGGHCVDMSCSEMLPYLEHMQQVEMYGLRFWCVGEDYLERVYGTDWRTPKHQWKPGT
jgi:hypothetical protein